jgi:hypothetical protein
VSGEPNRDGTAGPLAGHRDTAAPDVRDIDAAVAQLGAPGATPVADAAERLAELHGVLQAALAELDRD